MISIDKIKPVNNSKVSLSQQSFEMFVQNTCDYFMTLKNDVSKISPNEAIDVISTLTVFRQYFENESEWEGLTLQALSILQNAVKRSMFDKIASFGGMTHVAFVTHDLALTAPKVKPFHEGINKILLYNLTEYLKTSDENEFYTNGNYEVIKGLSGPLSYFLYANDDPRVHEMANRIIDIFIKRSKEIMLLEHRIPGWHYYPSAIEESFMTDKAKNGVINYGLSHGMAAPLVALSLAYKKGVRKDGLVEAVEGLISEYINASYYANDIAYWPGRITFEQYVGLDEMPHEPSQMSWCYGSVGILRSLYLSGVLMSNSKVEQFAVDEFIKIAKMSLSDYRLGQMIVCHGYIGTAAILNAMYLDTGHVQFLDKTIEMIEAGAIFNIERFFENERTIAQARNEPSRASLHNHLEGYNGILQTMLSILTGTVNGNEKRLLIA